MPRTDRLYYDHPSLREFEATVSRSEPAPEGQLVWLHQTAFYPDSGGQPHDGGTLGGQAVLSVQEDEDGGIVHLVAPAGAGRGLAPGDAVRGIVDWPRRFDHMQQHSGQHLLSAVLARTCGAVTLSFHLGTDVSTIDLDRELTASDLVQVERDVNQAIWQDRAVTVQYASADEARAMGLRKESGRTGTLRLISIDGLDLSACGGTHVATTGAIGQLAIAGWERFKGGQRVEFVCGGRALARHQLLRDVTTSAVRRLSVLPVDVGPAIDRLQAELKDERRLRAAAELELAGYEGARLAQSAEAAGGCRVVLRAIAADAPRLKALAAAVATEPGHLAVLVSSAVPLAIVAARATDVAVACGDLVGALARQFGGRGGGRPELAQGGGLTGEPAAVLAAARELVLQQQGR